MAEIDLRVRLDARAAEQSSRNLGRAFEDTGRRARRSAAGLDRLDNSVERLRRRMRRVGDGVGRLGRSLTVGLTLPLAAVGVATVSAAADMDRLERALATVAGSSGEADEQLRRLREVAKTPGLGFREAIQGSIRLQSVGFSALEAEEALKAFGNAIAAAGGGKAQLDRVSLALTQIASKGKVSAEEINQLAEAVPQIRAAMEAAFGTANTEEIQALGIQAEEFIAGVTRELGELDPVTGGAANAMENFGDSLFRARVAIGDRLLPVITPLIEGLADLLERTEALDASTVRWGIALGAVAAVLGPMSLALSSLTTAATALAGALSVSLLPLIGVGGAVLVGLGALATWLIKNRLEAAATRKEIEGLAEAGRDLSDAMPAELLDREAALVERQRELIARSNRLRATLENLPEGRLRESIERVAAGVLRELNAVNNRLEEVRTRLNEATTLEPIAVEVSARAAGESLDSTTQNFVRLEDAIADTEDRIGDLRFQLSSVFERDAESAQKLREELARLTRELAVMRAERARIIEQASISIPAPTIERADSLDIPPLEPVRVPVEIDEPDPPELGPIETAWEEAIRGIQRSFAVGFADIFRDGIDGFEDFASQILDIFVRLAAEIAAAFAVDKLGLDRLIQDIQAGTTRAALSGTAGAAVGAVGAAALGVGIGLGTASPVAGALGGAAAGAALGSVVPGLGTAVGAIVGGVSGLVSGLFGAGEKAREAARQAQRAAIEMERAVEQWRQSVERAFDTGPRDTLADQFVDIAEDRSSILLDALTALEPPLEAMEAFGARIAGLDTPQEILEFARNVQNLPEFSEFSEKEREAILAWARDIVAAGELMAEAAAQREADFLRDIEVRELAAQGRNEEADALRLQIQQEQELAEARALGFDEATIAQLEYVQGLEREAQAREAATDAIRDATSALNAPSGFRLSLFRWRAQLEEDLDELVPDPRQPRVPRTPEIPIGPRLPEPPPPHVDPLPPRGPGGLNPISMNINRVEIMLRSDGEESDTELARKVQRGLAQIGLRGGGDPTVVAFR